MNNFSNIFFSVLITSVFLAGSGCNILSSDSSDAEFRTEPYPILYIGKETDPYTEFHKKDLYSITADGKEYNRLTDYENYEVEDAAWAPDGDHIVIIRNQLNSMTQWAQNLYLVNYKGENGRKLITNDNDHWGIKSISTPVWSPNSDKIAFVGLTNVSNQGGSGAHDVYILDIEADSLQRITQSPGTYEELMCWSVSGKIYLTEIYKNTNPLKNQMVILSEEGERIKTWQHFRDHYTRPLISNNGQYFTFMKGRYEESNDGSNDQTEHRVMIMPPDGDPDSARVLTNGDFRSYKPVAWSPDDSGILTQGITINENRQQQEAPWRYHIMVVNRNGNSFNNITPSREDFYYEPVSWIDPSKIGTTR